jgi:predicted transposase YbfD/YdcC
MDPVAGASLRAHFAALPDPRVARTRRHALLDVVTLAVCAIVCAADTWVDVERWGKAKRPWLRTWLDLPHGIPSHDTFGRVFGALDPVAFEACFLGWVRALAAAADGQVVAIDGKTLRRSHDRVAGRNPLHLVSAWAAEQRLVLGQVATADRSNEIVAIPALLDVLERRDHNFQSKYFNRRRYFPLGRRGLTFFHWDRRLVTCLPNSG